MWKFIIIIVAIYIVYRLFANDLLKKRQEEARTVQAETDQKIAAGEMVKDPECGTYVSMDDSISVKNGPKTWYFCSYECRDNFLKKLDAGSRNTPHQD